MKTLLTDVRRRQIIVACWST